MDPGCLQVFNTDKKTAAVVFLVSLCTLIQKETDILTKQCCAQSHEEKWRYS